MIAATAIDALAHDHMASQVQQVARIQAALAALWDRTMDPADIDGSFVRFQVLADRLIKSARRRGEIDAQTYYEQVRLLSGYLDPLPDVPSLGAGTRANRASLHATSVATAKRKIAEGMPAEEAMTAAKAAMLRAAKRRILEASRMRVVRLSEADDNARGWARVSDGRPCAFCAMLVSRGPVYAADTVRFRAHDGCGCSAKPVFDNDPAKGWSPEARALRSLWDGVDDETGQHGSYDWRSTYNRAMRDPRSDAFRALTGEVALAA